MRRGPFELEAFYSDPQGVPYPEAKIGKSCVHLFWDFELRLVVSIETASPLELLL